MELKLWALSVPEKDPSEPGGYPGSQTGQGRPVFPREQSGVRGRERRVPFDCGHRLSGSVASVCLRICSRVPLAPVNSVRGPKRVQQKADPRAQARECSASHSLAGPGRGLGPFELHVG